MADKQECVICAAPITYAHLGINCCRACAVFYKRAALAKDELKCKDERKCIEHNPRTACRFCRFTKIDGILSTASMEPEPVVSAENVERPHTSSFIDHESYYDDEPSTSKTPQLDRLRKGYSLMCMVRHAGEMGTRTKCDEELEIQLDNLVLVPSTYINFPQQRKIGYEALKTFLGRSFTDFRELDSKSKELISKGCLSIIISLDSSYRTMHYFPNDDEIRSPGYTSYLQPSELELFFANNPDSIDAEKIASEVRKTLETSEAARQFYKQVKPTHHEFLAILGLVVWNDGLADFSESVQKIATKNRIAILRELHTYYSLQGKVDYACRIGQLFCLLIMFENSAVRLREEYQFYRLKNLFQEYIETEGVNQ